MSSISNTTQLVRSIPRLDEDTDTLQAAFAYAGAGFYLLPVDPTTKHPGSIVGTGWPSQSSTEPHVLAAWFAGTDAAIAIHAGRSGLIIFDVDNPDQVPLVLLEAIAATHPPFQSTRDNDPRRGHYVFRVPPGRSLGNRPGGLGVGWGEVRGTNGVIVVAPSQHTKDHGQYSWVVTGEVPELPGAVASLLPDVGEQNDAVSDAEIEAFLDNPAHKANRRPGALVSVDTDFRAKVAKGGSRHVAAVHALCWAMREARQGLYPARLAYQRLEMVFIQLMAEVRTGSDRTLSSALAAAEFRGCAAWAVGQAKAEVLDAPAEQLVTAKRCDDWDSWIERDPVAEPTNLQPQAPTGEYAAGPTTEQASPGASDGQLDTLARAHAAESRAADIVSEAVLRGRYRWCPALDWLRWDAVSAGTTALPTPAASSRKCAVGWTPPSGSIARSSTRPGRRGRRCRTNWPDA